MNIIESSTVTYAPTAERYMPLQACGKDLNNETNGRQNKRTTEKT